MKIPDGEDRLVFEFIAAALQDGSEGPHEETVHDEDIIAVA